MKLINKYLELAIAIDDEVIRRLVELGVKYYPNEYGGILIGKYSDDFKSVIISESINPTPKNLSKNKFVRNTDELLPEIEKYYNQTPSLYYVGEWHTHPDSRPIPSTTDLMALSEIVSHNEVYIKNPLLLIFSISKTECSFNFFVIFNDKIYCYEVENS